MATPESQIPLRVKGESTCIDHIQKQLDFYCEQCLEPICQKCLTSVHKSHPICELSEITPQKKQDIQDFIDKTEQNDLVQIGKYITSTDTLLKDNDSSFEKLSYQLKMQTDKLKQDLDMLTAETLSLYQEMKEDNTKLLQKYKQELEMYDKQLKQQVQECKTALQRGSHIHIYDLSCDFHSRSPPTNLHVKPVLGNASFTPNKNPRGLLELALGKINTSDQDRASTDQDRSVSTSSGQRQTSSQKQRSEGKGNKAMTRYALLPETKVVEKWRFPRYIASICPTIDDQAWTSGFNRTLNLLGRKGSVIQEVIHTVKINDISLSRTTHSLWVCDAENNIMKLASGRLTHRFKTKEEPRCICVTASNHVIVGMAKNISKFTAQGQMVPIITALGTGLYRIAECPVTHNVAVIDHSGDRNRRVVVMDADFKKLFVYKGDIPSIHKKALPRKTEQFQPMDMAYDSVGNLIIGNGVNRRVILLSGGGEFLGIIYTDTHWAEAVGVDHENVLWAVIGGENVKLLQYSSV